MSADLEARLSALEARLSEQEDRWAILQLIASYGPAVDSLNSQATSALWAVDGSYDWGAGPLVGAKAVGDLINLPSHANYVSQGCAHILSLPVIHLSERRARAINYSRVYLFDGTAWKIERCSANHWDLEKTEEGWHVTARECALLDGNALSKGHLAKAFKS